MKTFLHLSIIASFLATRCATDPETPSLYAGMSRDRLRARFGEPLHIEHPKSGGEDWYYNFTSPPELVGITSHDERTQTDAAAIGISENLGHRERPVHLSPDGFVTEPLPRGHLVK
jgi:hypothetical protein